MVKWSIVNSNLMSGIFEELLYSIISGDLKQEQIRSFCKSYIHIIKNELNRSFPRYSKTPFTKWYIKQYSIFAEILKIINAIENNTLHKLNDNLRSKAKNIKIID